MEDRIPWRKAGRVASCEARHCIRARALQTLVEACEVRAGGDNKL